MEPEVIEQMKKPAKSKVKAPFLAGIKSHQLHQFTSTHLTKKQYMQTKPTSTGVPLTDDHMCFHVFKVQHYASMSEEETTTDECLEELKRYVCVLLIKQKLKIKIPHAHQDLLYFICRSNHGLM